VSTVNRTRIDAAGWLVLAVNLGFLAEPAIRAVATQRPQQAIAALGALAGIAVLHLCHVRAGLDRAPRAAWAWTVAAQAVLTLASGSDGRLLALLAASALLALRPPWGYAVLAAVVLSRIPVAAADGGGDAVTAPLVTALVAVATVRLAALARHRERLVHRAVSDERLRFARDLHDLLGHVLCAIVLKSEVVGRTARARPDVAEREAADLVRLARDATREVRSAVSGYRTLSLDTELRNATAVLAAAGVRCQVDGVDARAVPPRLGEPLAWALREGVTNVLRHSRATICSITLRADRGSARLTVRNDGVQTRLDSLDRLSSNGLRGLNERLAGHDGTVAVADRGDGTFELVVTASGRGQPRGEEAPCPV
jgi:two-component system sensor histidine kinase DesK